jgi:hypothetical protein
MRKIVLTMALALSGALVATVANGSDDYKSWPGHKDHASPGLPVISKHSKKASNNKFGVPLKRKVHHREIHQYAKGLGILLKRKAHHGEIQAKDGWTIPLKRKVYTAKNNFHIPLRRAKHSRTDVGKDLAED